MLNPSPQNLPPFKVLTVVGTRPEIIRLSEICKELDRTVQHILVHTGQNYDYELNEIFFKDLGLRKPDYFLDAAKPSAVQTVGAVLQAIDPILEQEKPDAFLILGDTNSCLAAYAAKRRHIPIFHIEAGNRSFDPRVPEEINRRMIDHFSDLNIVYSENARQNLLHEGLPAGRIIKTGGPLAEVFKAHEAEIEASDILTRLSLKPKEYFLVTAHREENVDDPKQLAELVKGLNAVAERYGMPMVFSTHPRTKKRLEEQGLTLHPNIQSMKPLGFFDFNHLQKYAYCVLSDSGTISEESDILGFPAVNMRTAQERPEAMDETVVPMSGTNADRILQVVALVKAQEAAGWQARPVDGYAPLNLSKKILRLILGYTDPLRQPFVREK